MKHPVLVAALATLMMTGTALAHDGDHGLGGSPGATMMSGTPYAARLTPGAQVPGVTVLTDAFGSSRLMLSDDKGMLSVNVTFASFSSPTLFAHIHCCAPTTGNGPVAIDFAGFPVGVLEGSYSRTFDLNDLSTYGGAFVAAFGGTLEGARTAFLSGFEGGQAYVNIHSQLNPAGEVRGQIAAVPEPATWAMMILGFGLVGVALRRGQAPIPEAAKVATD